LPYVNQLGQPICCCRCVIVEPSKLSRSKNGGDGSSGCSFLLNWVAAGKAGGGQGCSGAAVLRGGAKPSLTVEAERLAWRMPLCADVDHLSAGGAW
jgi:hypothetical protein